MNRIKLSKILLTIFMVFAVVSVKAVPAYNGKLQCVQPDGTLLEYYIIGDETWYAFTTGDGYIVERDETGCFRYVNDIDGKMMPGAMAHNLSSRQAEEQATLLQYGVSNIESYYKKGQMANAGLLQNRINGVKKFRQNAANRAGVPYPNGNFPTTGSVKGLVLLVEFADNSFNANYTKDVFNGLMNTVNYDQFGAQGSSRDYFISQSMGTFTPQFDVVGPVKLSRNMAYYGADDNMGPDAKAGEMIEEACRLASETDVDFSQYDYNNDGMVDFVFVIYAGYGQNYGADANTIWPHTASLPDWEINLTLNGKTVGRYACCSELKYTTGSQLEGIGTFCHEFGHVLGLKDLYDTRHSNGTRIGVWSIMDQGCYNNESRTPCAYSAFERYSLGWMDYTDIDQPSDMMQLAEITENNAAYRIRTANENEYFTLENRQQKGWDAYLPGKGMMIMHIDYDKTAWDRNELNNGSTMRVDLVEADGQMSSDTYSTDLYPSAGNDKFTDTSSPNALSNDGKPTGKPVTQIRDVNGVITFRFMQEQLKRPDAPIVDEVGEGYVTCHWYAVDNAVAYRLQAEELIPAEENPLAADENFDSMTSGAYMMPDDAEMGNVLDAYLNLEGWTGENLRQAGGMIFIANSGSISSPLLDLSTADGQFTVGLKCQSGANQNTNITVAATRNNGKEIVSETTAVGNELSDIVLTMEGGISRTKIVLTAADGDVYIDRLRVMVGEVSPADMWKSVVHRVVADNIQTTSYTLNGLMPSKNYMLTLTALADDESLNSDASPSVLISTKEGLGMNTATVDDFLKVEYYNLKGQKVSHPMSGLYVLTMTMRDGRKVSEKVVLK